MSPDLVPLFIGLLIFLASLISLRLGISVAIVEIVLGAVAGTCGVETTDWMLYLASFGGVLLTYLAGTEIDTSLFREQLGISLAIGGLSFLLPFVGVYLFCHSIAHWDIRAALIAGTALSTTSLAVVYSVLVESGLGKSSIGKLLMAATFVTDMGTALALSILFIKPSVYTWLFLVISLLVIIAAVKFSGAIFGHPRLRNKVIEPEIKWVFLLLLAFMYFAKLGKGHAVLPAFVLGLLMSGHFNENGGTKEVRNRLRTVAYAFITPVFFLVGGLRVSLPLIWAAFGLFAVLFILKLLTKFVGVYFLAKRFIPHGSMYTTLLMSTGLTFGTISSLFGLNAGLIDQQQYSVLIGVVIASAVIPTFIAQTWFAPVHDEDLVDLPNES